MTSSGTTTRPMVQPGARVPCARGQGPQVSWEDVAHLDGEQGNFHSSPALSKSNAHEHLQQTLRTGTHGPATNAADCGRSRQATRGASVRQNTTQPGKRIDP